MRLLALLITLSFATLGYAQLVTDSTVAMIAFWEVGDSTTYRFTRTDSTQINGVTTVKRSSYTVGITVLDSTETEYLLAWQYGDFEWATTPDRMERVIADVVSATPLRIRTNEFGMLQALENWEAIGYTIRTAIEAEIQSADLPESEAEALRMQSQLATLDESQLLESLEDVLFFYAFYSDYYYPKDSPQEYVTELSYPLLPIALEADAVTRVVDIDTAAAAVHLRERAFLTYEEGKAAIVAFLRDLDDNLADMPDEELLKEVPPVQILQENNCIYNLDSGYVLAGSYVKQVRMELGIMGDLRIGYRIVVP